MHDKLFFLLDDWNQLCEEQNEITEAIAKLVGLPNAAIVLMTAYKDAIERELELWQKLSPRFESRHDAALNFCAEVAKRKKERITLEKYKPTTQEINNADDDTQGAPFDAIEIRREIMDAITNSIREDFKTLGIKKSASTPFEVNAANAAKEVFDKYFIE